MTKKNRTMGSYEVTNGEGRSEQEIYKQEIENVKSNRFMTDREKAFKINELQKLIKNKDE